MAVLYTDRLVLRDFCETDVDPLYAIQGNQEYMQFTHWAESREACAAWLRRYADSLQANGFAPRTVVKRSAERVIGWGGLNIDPFDPGWGVEVSYFIHPDCAGQGYATELVLASLQHGFGDLGLEAIGAFAMPQNQASGRVLEKCGFTLTGYEPALERNHYELPRDRWSGAMKSA